MIYTGDARSVLKDLMFNVQVDCIVTSPPYWDMRNYDNSEQLGREETLEEYITNLFDIFYDAYYCLKDTGTLWVNIGDKYIDGELSGIPWKLADRLKAKYYFKQDIIWYKPNAMPAGGTALKKCTPSHEHILFFTKERTDYYFDVEAIKEKAVTRRRSGSTFGGTKYGEEVHRKYSGREYIETGYRRKRDVWAIPTHSTGNEHPAPFPEDLPRNCILAGCPPGGCVLDMFCGSGTTGKAAYDLGRRFIGIELNPEYAAYAEKRIGTFKQATLPEAE